MAINTWAIDGDVSTTVKHPASVARLQTFVAFEGGEGIVNPTDLRVTQLPVAGTSVRVQPGAGSVLTRAAGVSSQAYAVEVTTPEDIPISPTDSSGPRSDLVILRVENPFLAGAGFQLPGDPTNSSSYTKIRVLRGVPSGTVNLRTLAPGTYGDVTFSSTDSAIALARLDLPASTGTIGTEHIKDLRSVIGYSRVSETVVEENPWTEVTHQTTEEVLYATSTSWTHWPDSVNWNIPVPKWATGMECIVNIDTRMREGLVGTPTGAWGEMIPEINGIQTDFTPTEFDFNWTGNPEIVPLRILGTLPMRPAWRGTVINFRARARMLATEERVRLFAEEGTYSTGFFHFKKNPIYT